VSGESQKGVETNALTISTPLSPHLEENPQRG